MKPLSTLIILLLTTFISCGQNNDYTWKQALAPGNGRFPENWVAGKYPMGIIPVVAFNKELYMVGEKYTWISKDGINWTVHAKTDWGGRYGMTISFFNGKLWMMGGMKSWDRFCNDVWSSADGKKWEQVKANADWLPRRGHNVVVFKNKLWLFGGSLSTGRPNKPPTRSLNDIWTSEDGVTWTNVSQQAKWNPGEQQAIVFNKKLWLLTDTDAWSSDDGKEWTRSLNKIPWTARINYGLLVFDEKLWFFGGREHHDVWYSTDGINWIQQTANALWSPRTTCHSVVYLNKLWIYSGKTGRDDSWSGDVWTMLKPM